MAITCRGHDEQIRSSRPVLEQVVGDDLTVTNPKKIAKAVDQKAANALLLKARIPTYTFWAHYNSVNVACMPKHKLREMHSPRRLTRSAL